MFQNNDEVLINQRKGSSYRLIKLLRNQGNHAQVWKVEHSESKDIFVLKYPNLKIIDEELWGDRVRRAQNEIDILKSINNKRLCPFIGRLVDSGISDSCCGEVPVLVLEYYSGGLDDEIKKNDQYTISKAIRWLKQITQAIHYLHYSCNELIHRDIKPANILIDNGDVRIIDFGVITSESGYGAGTSTMFSNKWAAPEQIIPVDMDNEGNWIFHLTTSIDVYALGLIAHYLFTCGKVTSSQIMGANGYTAYRNRYWNKKPYRISWMDGLREFAVLNKSDKDLFYTEISKILGNEYQPSRGLLENTSKLDLKDKIIQSELWVLVESMLNPNPNNRPKLMTILERLSSLEQASKSLKEICYEKSL